jgi:hypothetical protein
VRSNVRPLGTGTSESILKSIHSFIVRSWAQLAVHFIEQEQERDA